MSIIFEEQVLNMKTESDYTFTCMFSTLVTYILKSINNVISLDYFFFLFQVANPLSEKYVFYLVIRQTLWDI